MLIVKVCLIPFKYESVFLVPRKMWFVPCTLLYCKDYWPEGFNEADGKDDEEVAEHGAQDDAEQTRH